jgi:hypothetical protein
MIRVMLWLVVLFTRALLVSYHLCIGPHILTTRSSTAKLMPKRTDAWLLESELLILFNVLQS